MYTARGADDSFFLCKELIPGYLDGITGVYQTPQGYYVEDSDVNRFDKGVPVQRGTATSGADFFKMRQMKDRGIAHLSFRNEHPEIRARKDVVIHEKEEKQNR